LKNYFSTLRNKISTIVDTNQVFEQLPFTIANIPVPMKFPPEGLTLIFSPVNEAAKAINLMELMSEIYRPLQHLFTVEPVPSIKGVRCYFPTLKSVSIYMMLFNQRYFPASKVPPSPPPTQH